jgi:histidinol-phosphate aminotransferase
MSIISLARPEIVAMKPYSSARKEAPGRGILLNANESPWSLLTDAGPDGAKPSSGLNRYPDPQPRKLVSSLANLYGVPGHRAMPADLWNVPHSSANTRRRDCVGTQTCQ